MKYIKTFNQRPIFLPLHLVSHEQKEVKDDAWTVPELRGNSVANWQSEFNRTVWNLGQRGFSVPRPANMLDGSTGSRRTQAESWNPNMLGLDHTRMGESRGRVCGEYKPHLLLLPDVSQRISAHHPPPPLPPLLHAFPHVASGATAALVKAA